MAVCYKKQVDYKVAHICKQVGSQLCGLKKWGWLQFNSPDDREAQNVVKALIDSLNGKSNLVSNFNLDSFYEYLNSLGLLELSALYHLIVSTLICIISFNILSAVLGNEIIKYFNLEERFPKLAFFLRLRLKFQKYYLTLNFSLIFVLCIASILINIVVLY